MADNQLWREAAAEMGLQGQEIITFVIVRGAQGALSVRVGGATSQLDLSSLTPLFVAGYGRLQLGVPNWATSVVYCK